MSAPKELSNLGADVSEMGSTSSLRLYLTCEMHRGEIVVIFRFIFRKMKSEDGR